MVQDTLMRFLGALARFQGRSSCETYLFAILRRRIVDAYRGRSRRLCLLADVLGRPAADPEADPMAELASDDPSASSIVQRDEQNEMLRDVLAEAIRELINSLKKAPNFPHLKIVEMLFYCQLTNAEVADVAGIAAGQVAVIKHRCLKRVAASVERDLNSRGLDAGRHLLPDDGSAPLLSGLWERLRLSCPKRSTIGAYVLGTLDEPWRDYVGFHLDRLGCGFCLANRDDLKRQDDAGATAFRGRVMQSTIGFLRRSYLDATGKRPGD